MSNLNRIKKYIAILLFGILLGLIILMTIIYLPKSKNLIDSEKNALFSTSWKYQIDEKDMGDLTLPTQLKSVKNQEIILINYLPQDIMKGATVLVRTSQQNLIVYVEEEIIYDNRLESASSAYHFVRMPLDCAGKEIRIILISPLDKYAGIIGQIYIGSKASNVFYVIKTNLIQFILGALIFVLGIFFVGLFPFSKNKKYNLKVLYLGGFFLSSGIWILSESRILQFFIPYPNSITIMSILSLIVIPIFLAFYFLDYLQNRFKKTLAVIIGYFLTLFLISTLGGLFDVYFTIGLLFLISYSLIGFIFILLMIHINLLRKKIILKKISFIGLILLCTFCLINAILYLTDIQSYIHSFSLVIGIFVFSLIILIDLINNFSATYHDQLLVQSLKKVAYMDSLTGIKNSTSFYEDIERINLSKEKNVTFIMYDANDLKFINDNLGHLTGDKLLKEIAILLQESFMSTDCLYRIGGDEFVSIVYPNNQFCFNDYKERFNQKIKEINLIDREYCLSLAVGHADFDDTLDKNVYDTFNRADLKMYEDKKKYKHR